MLRQLFFLASLLSLSLCLTADLLGVLGPERTFVLLNFSYHHSHWQLVSKDGMLLVNNQPQRERELAQQNELFHQIDIAVSRQSQRDVDRLSKFAIAMRFSPLEQHGIPVSLVASLTLPLPAFWIWRYRARVALRFRRWRARLALWQSTLRQNRAGRCKTCSYDLTANTSGICPECGSPVQASTSCLAASSPNS